MKADFPYSDACAERVGIWFYSCRQNGRFTFFEITSTPKSIGIFYAQCDSHHTTIAMMKFDVVYEKNIASLIMQGKFKVALTFSTTHSLQRMIIPGRSFAETLHSSSERQPIDAYTNVKVFATK